MPLYEYRCQTCGKIHEVMQKFSEAPLSVCPDETCAGPVEKLMSLSSFALKGSGWYTTDYKKSSGPARQSSSSVAAGDAAAPAAPAPAAAPAAAPSPAAGT